MKAPMNFRFELPTAQTGPVVELSRAEAERILLASLKDAGPDRRDPLWNLAQFYKVNGAHEKALQRLWELMELLPDPESKAECIFSMGQAMEQTGDFSAAVRYYKEATALEPASTFTWYFIHNNLGYSLNQLGRFEEGAIACQRAIGIDPNRANAFKNLGVAVLALGDYPRAAQLFINATQVNAADGRSLGLLEELLRTHPELEFDFRADAEHCRKAVEFAAAKMKEQRAVPVRGWRKHWLLWRMRVRGFWKRRATQFG
jgi:tetratricopeptide (TPR) repeat protein